MTAAVREKSIDDLVRMLKDATDRLETAEAELRASKHKVEFYDRFVDHGSEFTMEEVAKILNIPYCGRNGLSRTLHNLGIILENKLPAQKYIDQNLFTLSLGNPSVSACGTRQAFPINIRVTGKGLAWLSRKFTGLPRVASLQDLDQ